MLIIIEILQNWFEFSRRKNSAENDKLLLAILTKKVQIEKDQSIQPMVDLDWDKFIKHLLDEINQNRNNENKGPMNMKEKIGMQSILAKINSDSSGLV
jgi:hypothetical protein